MIGERRYGGIEFNYRALEIVGRDAMKSVEVKACQFGGKKTQILAPLFRFVCRLLGRVAQPQRSARDRHTGDGEERGEKLTSQHAALTYLLVCRGTELRQAIIYYNRPRTEEWRLILFAN